jgi:hypothetical protein
MWMESGITRWMTKVSIAVLRPIKYIEVGKRKRSIWEWGFLA